MKLEIVMPNLGESIVEGTIVEWHKQVGERVEQDEELFTLSTDKVDTGVPAPQSGVLVEIRAQVDDIVEVGQLVAVIDTEATGGASAEPAAEPAEESDAEPAAEPAAEAEAATPDEPAAPAETEAPQSDAKTNQRISPVAKKLLVAAGVTNFGLVVGTGVQGRIVKADAEAYISLRGTKEDGAGASAPEASAAPESGGKVPPPPMHLLDGLMARARAHAAETRVSVNEQDTAEKMSPLKLAIGERMVRSRNHAAHCSTVWEVDVTKIVETRKALRRTYKERDVHLTYTPFFISAIVDALREFPVLNASVSGDEVVYRGDINVGIATPWNDGMVVPVVHGADSLNLLGLARSVNGINRRIQSGDVRPSDVGHGTFTVTNTGIYGSLYSIPTILQPQVAIMSIGRIDKRVKVEDDDSLRIRSMVHLSLTFDHRVVNFKQADSFMSHLRDTLEGWPDSELG